MGSTIYRVPTNVRTHERAKIIHDRATPIRGTDRRPLGARRDHIKYSVRMQGQDVQFVLFKTPVITYHPDNTITVRTDGWSSMATHEMIRWLLHIDAQGWRGNTRLMVNGSVYMIKGSESVKLLPTAEGGLCFESLQERLGYRMNRKAANNVRRRYAPFLDYLKGMLKLREQEVELRSAYRPISTTVTTVVFSAEEMAQVAGVDFYLGNVTEQFRQGGGKYNEVIHTQRQRMLDLINPDQPEETRHENFYKAALSLARGYTSASEFSAMKAVGRDTVLRERQDVLSRADEALLMAHAQEVLEVTKLEGKAMPNPKYMGWIDKEI